MSVNVSANYFPPRRSSYSAPGHIQISLPALPAALEGKLREVKELRLFMEGKSEFYNDAGNFYVGQSTSQ